MRIRRYKKAFKSLSFYVNNFGFHKPFQLLIDGTFCFAALVNRIQIKEDIPRYLGNEIKFLTTQCVILETEKLGHQALGAMHIVKTFGVHNCGHKKKVVTGSDCLLSMVGRTNENRYIIATQDKDLQKKLMSVPAVPVLYINRTSIILKPLSESSIRLAQNRKEALLGLSDYQEKVLSTLKKTNLKGLQKEEELREPRKPKGPNPLSCKKKKKPVEMNCSQPTKQNTSKKRKRKRIRLPKHVKEELRAASNCK